MEKEEAKKQINAIFRKVITDKDEIYWLNDTYIRWGKVERDIYEAIDKIGDES